MSKSMLMGAVAGAAIATAGGVAGYTFIGATPNGATQGAAALIQVDDTRDETAQAITPVPAALAAPTAAPVARQVVAPAPVVRSPAPTAAPARERCWDEEVIVTEAPKDEHRIGGTAAGAVVGGAIGKEIADSDLGTAVGAAAGAFIGRRIQRRVQENNAEQRTTTRIERRCEPL